MKPVPEERLREVESWFRFVSTVSEEYDTQAGHDAAIAARAHHVLGRFDQSDYERLSESLLEADSSASFVFLGRDIDEEASIISDLAASGHEITLHGYRHIGWGDLGYDQAHDYLVNGLEAIESSTGITPRSFFAPLKSVSEGTLKAASDLDIDWVLGRTDADVPSSVTLIDTVYPHDNRLLEYNMDPGEAFDQFAQQSVDGETFLFHPNMLEYHGATDEFDDWISSVQPVSVQEQLTDGGVGVVMDCIRPMVVR